MRKIKAKLKPASGFSGIAHAGLQLLYPLAIFVLICVDLSLAVPLLVIVLGKWRMFAVRPRFWVANIRANAVDMMVGFSVVLFMAGTQSLSSRAIYALLYTAWLLFIKPGNTVLLVSLQAMIAYMAALLALFVSVPADVTLGAYVAAVGVISYLCAHHFFDSFDEPYARFLAYMWAFVSAALMWVLGHWLLFYGFVAQPALMLVAVAYGLAGIYYFDHHDRLSRIIKLELVFIMSAIAIINIAALLFSTRVTTTL